MDTIAWNLIDKYFKDNSQLDTLIVDEKLINNIKDAFTSEKCIEQYEIKIKDKNTYKTRKNEDLMLMFYNLHIFFFVHRIVFMNL